MFPLAVLLLMPCEDIKIIDPYFRREDNEERLSSQNDLLGRFLNLEQLVLVRVYKRGNVVRIEGGNDN